MMITASERLVRIPAEICGEAAGNDEPADPLPPRDVERPRGLEQGRVDRADPVHRVQQDREEAEERDERHLLDVADRMQENDRDRQQRRRRHRAPVLDVRHRQRAGPARHAERDAETDADDRRDAESEDDPLEARDDMRSEVREQPHVPELDQDRREPREVRVVRVNRPQLPRDEHRDRHRDLGCDLETPVGLVAHDAVLRWDGCQCRIRFSSAESARWMPIPRKPIASASA